ncbi:MAG: pyridoxal phosphate-dependent aminotransferase [Thermoprotei archaeon]
MGSIEDLVAPQIKSMKFTDIWSISLSIANYADSVYLSAGEPDFDTPSNIVKAGEDALKSGKTHYVDPSGLPELREEISKKLKRENSIDADPDEIIVTVGGQEALYNVFQTFVRSGDKVLLITPTYPLYLDATQITGAVAKQVPLTEQDHSFSLDIEKVKQRIKAARIVIINNPSNPTGYVMTQDEIRALVEVAKDEGALIVSDEIYEKMNYSGKKLISPASIAPENTITINGFSKAFAMTGWRIGYMAAPREVIEPLKIVHHTNVICANSISQYAALEALRGPKDSLRAMVEEYRQRMELLYGGLAKLPGINVVRPDGAIYVFPDFSDYEKDDKAFALRLARSTHVATVPGSGFGMGGEGHLRLTFASSRRSITDAVARISDYLTSVASKIPE